MNPATVHMQNTTTVLMIGRAVVRPVEKLVRLVSDLDRVLGKVAICGMQRNHYGAEARIGSNINHPAVALGASVNGCGAKSHHYEQRAHRSNENKMSDGGRGRASLGVEGWKSSQKWSVQRSAVRSIAWLGFWTHRNIISVNGKTAANTTRSELDNDEHHNGDAPEETSAATRAR